MYTEIRSNDYPPHLEIKYYVQKIRGLGLDEIKLKWIIGKILGAVLFWSYQLDSTANPVHLPEQWAKLAVLFSW